MEGNVFSHWVYLKLNISENYYCIVIDCLLHDQPLFGILFAKILLNIFSASFHYWLGTSFITCMYICICARMDRKNDNSSLMSSGLGTQQQQQTSSVTNPLPKKMNSRRTGNEVEQRQKSHN